VFNICERVCKGEKLGPHLTHNEDLTSILSFEVDVEDVIVKYEFKEP